MKQNQTIRRLIVLKCILLATLLTACPPDEDDYVASWPQNVIENNSFDESVEPGPLEIKANVLDEWNVEWHQPYYGAQIDRVDFTDTDFDEVRWHIDGGDSALHTGIYLASQALRYHVTKSPAALENAKKTVRVLSDTLHITGRRGYIARLRAPKDEFIQFSYEWCAGQKGDRCHVVTEGPYAGDFWLGDTSRDMYKGWMFGMTMAYDFIDDEETRAIIRSDVYDVVSELIANDWNITAEDGQPSDVAPLIELPDRVSFAIQGYHVTGDPGILKRLKEFLLNGFRPIFDVVDDVGGIDGPLSLSRYDGYYVHQLNHMDFFHLLRLGKFYFNEDDHGYWMDFFNERIHTFTRLSHAPFLNIVYMSQGGWQQADNDPYLNQLLEDFGDLTAPAVMERRPGPQPGMYEYDPFSLDGNALYLKLVNSGVDFLAEDVARLLEILPQTREALPIPLQCQSPNYQQNPFRICETVNQAFGDTWTENGQAYLVPYWMARYYGIIAKDHGLEVAAITMGEDEGKKGKKGKGKKPKKPKKEKKPKKDKKDKKKKK